MAELTNVAARFITNAADNVVRKADGAAAQTTTTTATAAAKNAFGNDARVKATAAAAAASGKDLPKVVVPGRLRELVNVAKEGSDVKVDGPRLSADGSLATYVMRETKDIPKVMKQILQIETDVPTERMSAWVAHVDGSEAPVKIAGHTFHNIVEPAFTPDGKSVIYCAQKNLPFLAYGERLKDMRLEQVELATGKVKTIYDGERSFLHPQYSPDGTKLAVYCRDKGHEGIYVFDMTKPGSDPIRLSTGNEKHPVWTADGDTILFHNQVGGDATEASATGAEEAWLGKIDVSDLRAPKLTMLDDPKVDTYHKHPTPVPNSNLVVYHNADHKLEVVDTVTGQRGELHLDGAGVSPNGADVKKFKHAVITREGNFGVLGEPKKGEALDRGAGKDTWTLYQGPSADAIIKAFNAVFGG